MAELLLSKNYEVHGIKRRASSFNTDRIDHLYQDPHESQRNLHLHYGDLTDAANLIRIVQAVQPDEIYNLAAQSHVAVSFDTAEYTANADAMETLRLLEAIRILGLEKKTRFYQASTSERYGKVQGTPQPETTPFYPRSPYGAAKVYAYRPGGIPHSGVRANSFSRFGCPHPNLPHRTCKWSVAQEAREMPPPWNEGGNEESRAIFLVPSLASAGDDCMDAGGRVTPGAVTEG